MSVNTLELAERIHGEVAELDRVIERTQRIWSRAVKPSQDQDLYIDSVALNLHGWYSGIERLFELIARHIDRKMPSGETWHRDLLEQMARDATDARPAVISQASADGLDEFRRFRHLVRNVYTESAVGTTNLVPEKIAK